MTTQIIGWAIIHSVWQGGFLAALAALAFFLARRSPPAARYAMGLGFLILMAALPLATALRMAVPPTVAVNSVSAQSGERNASKQVNEPDPGATALERTTFSLSGAPSTVDESARRSPSESSGLVTSIVRAMPWIVTAWLLGLLLTSLQLIGGLARTRRITRHGTSAAAPELLARVRSLADRLGISERIRVLESIRVDVPLVIGALRPVIVVPVSLVTGLTPLQIDMLLAHELAHIRRYDFVVNLAQTVIETLLFYHPGARWLSERIRDERESCCDDIAVATCGGSAASYTETLLVLEESRTAGFGLAAAATGGSLLRRAKRLLSGGPAHIELGPRWIAGVITISAALFTGREATGTVIQASLTPSPIVQAGESDTTEKKRAQPDPSKAGPANVVRAPTTGSLADRWRWADQRARGIGGSYWIGYLVAGDETGKSRYYADDIPVRIDGDVTISGHMHMGAGDLSAFTFHGVPLTPIAGPHSPYSTAIFMLMNDGVLGRRIERVHVGSFSIPVYFNARPVIWLDSATDTESVDMIRSLTPRARTNDIRRDLVAAVGVHQSPDVVVPILIGLLESRSEPEDVRREATEWLGRQRDPRAIGALSRAVRSDRSSGVREEAIEAFSHMESPPATDSLISFASTVADYDQKRTAIEALGHRTDQRAVDYLTRVVRGTSDSQLKGEAVEALATMPDGKGFRVVMEFARSDPSPDVRRKAVEAIGGSEPGSRALEVLMQVVRTDPDESIRAEAVETIAEVHDARAVSMLRDLANSNPSRRVQIEAVESLGETVDDAAALAVVRSIARSHPSIEVRMKALETLGGFHDEPAAIEALIEVARGSGETDLRKAALEALGESESGASARALASIVHGRDEVDFRRRALEVHAESMRPLTAIVMLRSVMASDASVEMRLRALELLGELNDDAGIGAVREVARSHREPAMRSRAVEILNDR
ncbi:MAG: HEAT repeat domain-containing protein [Gemmatimonadaceae bacterium]|nr:HEAT repeat domain-containing protein [Gemmatimonadaceae bacterium]